MTLVGEIEIEATEQVASIEVEISQGLQKLCKETKLSEAATKELVSEFIPLLADVESAIDIVNSTKVKSAEDFEAIVAMKEAASILITARTSSSKKKDELAEDFKKGHKAIVAVNNYIADTLAPFEALAKQGRDFVKLQEQKRLAEEALARQERISQRDMLLVSYGKNCADLGCADVTDSAFEAILKGIQSDELARIAVEEAVQAEALAQKQAQEAERARLAEENRLLQEKLAAERLEKEVEFARQRAAAQEEQAKQCLGYERMQTLQRFNLSPSCQAWIDKGADFFAAMSEQDFTPLKDAIGYEHQQVQEEQARAATQRESALQKQLADVATKAQAAQEVTQLVQASHADGLAERIIAEILVVIQNSDGVACGNKVKPWRETKRLYPLLVEWEAQNVDIP